MRDYYAAHPLYLREQLLALKSRLPVPDKISLVDLLAQTVASENTKVLGQELYTGYLGSADYRKELEAAGKLHQAIGLGTPAQLDLSYLPDYSFFLRADFSLEAPYLSRDDRLFSVTENPVRKDWVFGLPLIASTTWKGALRNACRIQAQEAVGRLFGPEPPRDQEQEEEPSLHAGRVYTFASFFNQIGLEIINPHDRQRRVGKNPIKMECVPKGARSRLTVLYIAIPRDDASWNLGPADFRKEIAGDLVTLANCVRGMMRDYGFSAKKSSGYGTATDALTGERGLLYVAGVDSGRATFSKFSDLVEVAELLAAKIRGRV